MKIHTAGIDIGKYVFHFVGLSESGEVKYILSNIYTCGVNLHGFLSTPVRFFLAQVAEPFPLTASLA